MEQLISKLDQHKANASFTKLESKSFASLASMPKPPAMVKNVSFFLMMYLGFNQDQADNWGTAKETLFKKASETCQKLNNLDKENCFSKNLLSLLTKFIKESSLSA